MFTIPLKRFLIQSMVIKTLVIDEKDSAKRTKSQNDLPRTEFKVMAAVSGGDCLAPFAGKMNLYII
jgi:hypothetical protein